MAGFPAQVNDLNYHGETHVAVSEMPLSVCPLDMQGTIGTIETRNVSVIGVKSVKSCAPSSTPWKEVMMLCSEPR